MTIPSNLVPMRPFDCFDAYATGLERWFEWQRVLWQPIVDAQSAFIQQWQGQLRWCGWPASEAVWTRGGEQLG